MTSSTDAVIETIEENDVRGVLAIGGLLAFFLTVWAGLYMVSRGFLTIEEIVQIMAIISPIITLGIGYYFGQQG
jgi:hypothetical protein